MKTMTVLVLGGMLAVTPAAETKLPEIDGAPAVASVNGEPVTLDEYRRAFAELHAGVPEEGGVPPNDPMALLDRLVNLRLVFQEARQIGLDELPEFEKAVSAFRRDTLRGMLLQRVMGTAPPPEPAAVERKYREIATEIELASAWFGDRESADAFRAAVQRGEEFVALGSRLAAEGKVERFEAPVWIRSDELAPGIVSALDAVEEGRPAGPVPHGPGFAVVRKSGSRLPDDPALREESRRQLASEASRNALETFIETLRTKHLRIDEELLEGLDLDADPENFDRFLEDERVVATMEGVEPIRVRDLARTVKNRMFHGVEQAATKGRLNRSKANVLEELTTERLLQEEARRRGLDRLPEFEIDQDEYEEQVLFGLFVQKAVDPRIEVTWDEVQAYYRENVTEFTDPEMVRLDSIVFAGGEDARKALERLNAGADPAWMRENASGQVPPEEVPGDLRFAGRLLMVSSLPGPVRVAIAGAGRGDQRLWAETPDRHHLLRVVDRVVPEPRPVEEVRQEIASRIFAEERSRALEDWFRKLREVSEVEVFVDAKALRGLVARP